jgi:hypothetical protein
VFGTTSERYLGSTGTLGNTISTALFIAGELQAVSAIDFGIGAIDETVKNAKILNNGYGFLVTPAGKVGSHPRVDPTAETKYIDDMEVRGARACVRAATTGSLSRPLTRLLARLLIHSRFLLVTRSLPAARAQ